MLLLRNGTVHVGNGNVLEDTDVLIENGKIIKVSKNIITDDAEVIDAKGLEIFPGFIDPLNGTGCKDILCSNKDDNEDTNPITPYADIKYSFNPNEVMLEELYKVGITAIGAAPGNLNVIGGKMAAFRTYGTNVNKMLIKECVGLKGSVTNLVKNTYGKRNVIPQTKMGIFNLLKETFKNPDKSLDKEVIEKVLNRDIPLFISAETQSEIEALIESLKDFNIKLVICYGYQGDRCVESLKKHNASLIIGEQVHLSKTLYSNTDLCKLAEMQSKDGLLSFTISGCYGPQGRVKYLWNAARFHEAGFDSEEIVKMMTIYPAEILGIDDMVGTIEKGKDADIVIYSSNPVKYYNARVKFTIMQGKVVFEERVCCKSDN